MGLLDKLKNVFFEEEYVEVEEKNEPKEKVSVAKKIETPEVRKKEEIVLEQPVVEQSVKEQPVKEEKDFKFPLRLDDKDFEIEKTIEMEEPIKEKEPKEERHFQEQHFEEQHEYPKEEKYEEVRETREYRYEKMVEEEPVRKEPKQVEEVHYEKPVENKTEEEGVYHRLYEGSKEKEEKPSFKPSPIISPIYGILNKNYTKEEIMTKKEIRLSQVTTKKADLDLVREKAYGDLAGDISASIEEDASPEVSKEIEEDIKDTKEEVKEKEDLLYDLNDDESPTVKVVTVGDAEEYFSDLGLEYNVDYKVEKEGQIKTNSQEDDSKEEVEEKEENKEQEEKEQEEKEDEKNLFDLIDSMYEDDEKDKE